jgi:predicted anti-sigma-YlaC factor YlaD
MLMNSNREHCQRELVAAYLDGELDATTASYFETHVDSCKACHAELNAQRLFMNDLDFSLASTPALSLPKNFAQIVAARAESDMSGVRSKTEHKLAFRFCVILALMSFALLGAAAIRSIFFSGESIANKTLGVFDLLWTALRDAAVGLIVIMRVIGQVVIPESHFAGLMALILALAIVLLSLLISSYHRYRKTRLIE